MSRRKSQAYNEYSYVSPAQPSRPPVADVRYTYYTPSRQGSVRRPSNSDARRPVRSGLEPRVNSSGSYHYARDEALASADVSHRNSVRHSGSARRGSRGNRQTQDAPKTYVYAYPDAPISSEESVNTTYIKQQAHAQRPPESVHIYSTRGADPRYNQFSRDAEDGDFYEYGNRTPKEATDSRFPRRRASVHASAPRRPPANIVDTSDETDDYCPTYAYIRPKPTVPKNQYYVRTSRPKDDIPYYSASTNQARRDSRTGSLPSKTSTSNSTVKDFQTPGTRTAAASAKGANPTRRQSVSNPVRGGARVSSSKTTKKERAVSAPLSSSSASKCKSTYSSESFPPEAIAALAAKYGIPASYSFKHWDPEEAPITLLGSVFDANSLGKWIYDWTVLHHGAHSPMSEVAGDLWLLLIKLAHKTKRAEECLPRIRHRDDAEMVDDFVISGNRLWRRVKHLLRDCEDMMLEATSDADEARPLRSGSSKAVRQTTTTTTARSKSTKSKNRNKSVSETRSSKTTKSSTKSPNDASASTASQSAGCQFVDAIFGRDRMLNETEVLMQSIRLWNVRFDANCEDILRHPQG